MNQGPTRAKVLSAGILSLLLMVGIARFAYTPLLPVMQEYAKLGVFEGGWLAAINYAGYLSGALLASVINDLRLKDKLYRAGLIVAVVSTVVMGLSDDFWWWSVSRYFAGLSSAAGLLLGSGLVLHWLMRNGHRPELGVHFSGMGLGIALPTLLVLALGDSLTWDQLWMALAFAGVLILVPAWRWLPAPDCSTKVSGTRDLKDAPPGRGFLRLFMVAYFCAGVGYVISMTFIVAIVDQLPALRGLGNWSFVVLGIAAAPACIVWDLVARRVGDFAALALAYFLQMIGILLPLLFDSALPTLLGAALFGGTFIGVVSLVLSMAGRYYPSKPAKMMGKMTLSYGVAQIVAPAFAALLASHFGHYEHSLYAAIGMLALGTVLILYLRGRERKQAMRCAAAQ